MANKIKDMPKIDQPREKLLKYGAGKLTDVELLAILLRTGTKDLNVLKLSQKILQKFNNKKIVHATIDELKDMHGLGLVKACEILACFELGKRMLVGKISDLVLSPREVWERMADVRASKREHFVVFFLDSRDREVMREIVSVGILDESLVHPREVFEPAIKHNAASIIVAHNHPSGDFEPSTADKEITKKLIHAGKILGIPVIDHVIVTASNYQSIGLSNL
jgi:DNA repair protein RadC